MGGFVAVMMALMAFSDNPPWRWSKPWRRAFVLTFPISVPLWMGVWFAVALIIVATAIALMPIVGLIKIWNGTNPFGDDE